MPSEQPENLSDLLPEIRDSLPPESQSVVVGKREQSDMMAQIALDKANEELRGLAQDREERKSYAEKSFRLVCRWVIGVFCILILQGFLSEGIKIPINGIMFDFSFKLPDSVLLAVVGGTTASIISIFIVVANYLFPKR
jgi:hypothetical protein